MDKLIRILRDIKPHLDFEKEQHLIDDGLLDSFDIITIVSEINNDFSIEITVVDLVPENFNNINAIWNLVNHLISQ